MALKSRDELKEEEFLEIKPTVCPKCSSDLEFRGAGEYVCTVCGCVVRDDFGKVRHFLDVNGPSPALIISENTGVSLEKINHYLRQGRIEIPDGSEQYIYCEGCGCEIRYGRFCQACANRLSKDLKGAFAEVGEAPKHSKKSGGASMRFLGSEKKKY